MRHLIAVLVFLAVTLTIGCTSTTLTHTTSPTTVTYTATTTTSTVTETTNTAITEPVPAPQLQTGTVFEYRSNGNAGYEEVVGQFMLDGQAAYCIKTVYDYYPEGTYNLSYFSVDGFRRIQDVDFVNNLERYKAVYAPEMYVGFPLCPPTLENIEYSIYSYENELFLGRMEYTYSLTVDYVGTVHVPAGAYDCYIIRLVWPAHIFIDGKERAIEYYYSPELSYLTLTSQFIDGQMVEQWQLVGVS